MTAISFCQLPFVRTAWLAVQQEAPQIPHGKIALGVAVSGEGGGAGEGRVVGIPMFHSWGTKCTMPLTNIKSDWMSNASSCLCINLFHTTWVLYFTS